MWWCLFVAVKATPRINQGHMPSTTCLQVPISCNDGMFIKFLLLLAFFKDIKYFCASKMVMWTFKCGLMNLLLGAGNWKFEKYLKPIGSGFRVLARVLCIQRIAYYDCFLLWIQITVTLCGKWDLVKQSSGRWHKLLCTRVVDYLSTTIYGCKDNIMHNNYQ
jgi:hypothetical protein